MIGKKTLTRKEFFNHIDKKCNSALGSVKCESCGGNAWNGYSDDNGRMIEVTAPVVGNHDFGINFYAMKCENCGQLRFFASDSF